MKTITLQGPATRNDGGYADAGSTLVVGAEPDQISSARARMLIRGRRARQASPNA